jgi:hypothetical protein
LGEGNRLLLQGCNGSRRVGLRDAEPLRQGRQQAGRGIAEGARRREEGGEQDRHPLMRVALAHAAQMALHDLERRGCEGDQKKAQPIVRGRERTVLRDRAPAGDPRLPIEAPRSEMRLERRLTERDDLLKLIGRHAGHIQAC